MIYLIENNTYLFDDNRLIVNVFHATLNAIGEYVRVSLRPKFNTFQMAYILVV